MRAILRLSDPPAHPPHLPYPPHLPVNPACRRPGLLLRGRRLL